jgi:spectinomycin phosphotransferase
VRDRPEGITERAVARALADGWGLTGWTLEYAPVGGGSYHWLAAGGAPGERRFVTVDDLDDVTLRRQAGLGFVVAPEPALTGEAVRPAGDRHAVAVFPFLTGTPGDWAKPLPAPERGELIAMLAALHAVDPGAVRLPRFEAGLSWRGDLETALAGLGQPWAGGPYAEPARELLAGAAGTVRRQLGVLDRRAPRLAAAEAVITHGEPHPGNVVHAVDGLTLIDWDTIALAPPERDLWMVATGSGDEVRRYTELTGRPVDPAALEFYRLRWALDDLSCFVRDLRVPHRRTPGAEDNWAGLEATLADLTR